MTTIRKTVEIKILEKTQNGGRIIINTPSVDRDKDRVYPAGVRSENYLKNPVVQWGHDYRSPWATIGKTTKLTVGPEGLTADFELRPAANDQDPQNIIRLLWDGGWVRTASIGFIPSKGVANAEGGYDFTEWELLEWSLVPIPSNQDALALAIKGLAPEGQESESQNARTIFAKGMVDTLLDKTLSLKERDYTIEALKKGMKDATVATTGEAPAQTTDENGNDEAGDHARAWVRRLTVDTGAGLQTSYAVFSRKSVDVPADATLLQFDFTLGECKEVPHPEAGQTVAFKTVRFIPAIEIRDFASGYSDSLYAVTQRDCKDEELLGESPYWDVREWSKIVDELGVLKSYGSTLRAIETGFGIDYLTQKGIDTANKFVKHLANVKRGRVLSASNETKLKGAQEKAQQAADEIGEVLKQVDEQPETAAPSDDAGKSQSGSTDSSETEDKLTAEEERELAALEERLAEVRKSLKENK